MERELYFYEYVERTVDDLVAVLSEPHSTVFQTATDAAVAETNRLHARLHVDLGGLDVGREVTIELGKPERRPDAVASPVRSRQALEQAGDHDPDAVVIPIKWHAARHTALFPSMDASLEISALDHHIPLTQLSIIGRYHPPAGVAGAVGDRILGHRLAEAAVRHFVTDLAARLAPVRR